ncbi:MAG TPA: serine hydrolase domain-containing protein [Pyrinomonadaceae bacterium]|nr:serine hydrolase domain-containing protein [Pyrinomonadaceae bacterium]
MLKNVVVFLLLCTISTTAQTVDKTQAIAGADRVWEKTLKAYVAPGPGCAVGISVNGESVWEKAFGVAEMEHNIPNTPQTIFESGSVAKQFTAAAIVILQQDGKLKLDDDIRKYLPEMPEYDKPITIRNILTHTAGLRDWGSVMELTGAGRGNRVVTQDIAYDVIINQRGLDFTPGAEYSYSNSGYQLAAIIVERVSKQKFGDFVTDRLFKPLGMKNSSWRDDYQRLVPGRAQGYAKDDEKSPWKLNMPIMNVVGNGGMLTTVGDWLKWNAMLDSKSLGAPLVDALETQAILNDGRKITYALGLEVATYKGVKEVSHSGGTAGYQTYLARYPDRKLSIAGLCNGYPPAATDLVHSIADEILGPFPASPKPPDAVQKSEDELKKLVGIWRNERTHRDNRITFDKGELKINGGPFKPVADGSFLLPSGAKVIVTSDKDGRPTQLDVSNPSGVTRLFAETEWTPTAADLSSLTGDWYSEEARAGVTLVVEGDKAFITQRPTLRIPLRPSFKDHFSGMGFVFWFTRDASGKIDKMHVGGGRMRDMPFVRGR